jgi:hypothetical protein
MVGVTYMTKYWFFRIFNFQPLSSQGLAFASFFQPILRLAKSKFENQLKLDDAFHIKLTNRNKNP